MRKIPNFMKIAIKGAFIDLLKRKPLNQITVKDIVEECGINRNSFYYHFQDIGTLIEDIVTEETDRIISQYSPLDPIETCIKAAFDFAENYRTAILHIYRCMDRAVFEKYLWRVCENIVSAYVGNEFVSSPVTEEDKEAVICLYKCECFGLLVDWLNRGMQGFSAEETERYLRIHNSMLTDFERHSRNHRRDQ